jgi:type IX secretion system PorP/SprF family membrane protein
MKKALFIFLLVAWYSGSFAQQDPQFTQYMLNKTLINPACAGISGAICASGFGRYQWLGYQDSVGYPLNPRMFGVSFDMPVYSINSGVGLTVLYNRLGAEKNLGVRLNYSYQLIFDRKHLFSFGLSLGLMNKSINYSKLKPAEFDPLLESQSVEKGTITDFGFGVHYQLADKFYTGLSANNLLGSNAEIGGPEFNLARHYYLFGGYNFELKRLGYGRMVLTPGFLLKATQSAVQLDLNAILIYNDFVWGGLMYRIENAIGVIAGVNIHGIRLGVSYDYTMSKNFATGNRSSVEFIVKYCYSIYPPIVKKSGYNIRNM